MDETKSPHTQLEKDRILKSCQELINTWAQPQFKTFLLTLDERLFNMADKADNNKDQTHLFQTRDEINRHHNFIQQQFFQQLAQSFSNYLNSEDTTTDHNLILNPTQSDIEEQNLSLVDNTELEEKLAIAAMSRKASADCSELLYALNQRFSALSGGRKITDQGNPVAPGVFGDSLRKAISALTLDSHPKILLYKIFESSFSTQLTKLYLLLNHHLETKGVLPHLSYYIQKDESAQITEQLPQELHAQTSEASIANQINLLDTIRLLQSRLSPQPQRTGQRVPAAQIIAGIQQLQYNAGSILSSLDTPQAVAASHPDDLRKKAEHQARQQQEVDEHIIEIVGLLFEYMLNDQQLPDSVKTLLSYLHTPFLKIALLDQDFFNHPDHPARQLLNSLVAAGERWVEPTGKHKSDVFLQIKNIVQRLLNEFDNDVRLFSELAFDFNHYLRQHARRIRLAEKRAMQAAQGENKLKEIRMRVDGYLKKKMGSLALPSALQTLLLEPWANFLSFNLLRFGSNSQEWRKAAQAVDDIL